MEHVLELFEGVYQTGRWPVGVYPGWLRYSVTFLIPVGFAVTVPAEAVTSRLDWPTLLLGLGAQLLWAGIGFVLFSFAWRAAIKRFSAVGG